MVTDTLKYHGCITRIRGQLKTICRTKLEDIPYLHL